MAPEIDLTATAMATACATRMTAAAIPAASIDVRALTSLYAHSAKR
jgi:hypothetical protein